MVKKKKVRVKEKSKTKYIKKNKKVATKQVNARILVAGFFATLLFMVVIAKLAQIQFVQSRELTDLARKQQEKNEIISPNRGTIYDVNGEILAQSVSVDTVSVNPGKVTYTNTKDVPNDKLAQKLSEIFELDYNDTFEKVSSTKSVVVIARKVEKEKVDKLKEWMNEEGIYAGINIDEDSKRYYPYNTLAANLIGFCGTDNSGQTGLEERWDNVLTGTAGKVVTVTDRKGNPISDEDVQYVATENGSNVYLTIDAKIQATVEKYLAKGMVENPSADSGIALVMRPQTGEILAMASYPTYNLNTPSDYFATGYSLEDWNKLEQTQKSESLMELWKNRCVSETYEPGSTFKLITASTGLEEGKITTDNPGDFYCSGSYVVDPDEEPIKCWRAQPHGSQCLREALENSCNPAFMQLGQRIGARTLYKYFQAFGLFEPCGNDIAKAYKGQFYKLEEMGPVELATTSFGQRFEISPLQLVTAVSAICNDGQLVKPKIVGKIENTDTGSIDIVETENIRQVISKDTADKVKNMMLSVVMEGTGKRARIDGYSIGGKSGTSEPRANHEEEGYVASFIGISPIENTQVVVLVALKGLSAGVEHQGGAVSGPIVHDILAEVLPYLGVANSLSTDAQLNQPADDEDILVALPNVKDMTLADATKKLQELGFNVITNTNQDPSTILVTDQLPKYGINLTQDSVVCLYTSVDIDRKKVTVPNIKDMTAAQAKNALKSKNLNINVEGTNGIVVSQDPTYETEVDEGTVVNVVIQEKLVDAH